MSVLVDRITEVLRKHRPSPLRSYPPKCRCGEVYEDFHAHVAERVAEALRPDFEAVVEAIWDENGRNYDQDGNFITIDVVTRHRNMAAAALAAAGWPAVEGKP